MSWFWIVTSYTINVFAVIGVVLDCFLLGMHILAIIYAKSYMNIKPPELMKTKLPGVSILKPLKGVDPNLEDNLETFFDLNYPEFEIIFCIHDKTDPAHEVVNRLISKHPNIPARVITGGSKVGANPKINNLMPGYEVMKYNYFWICDSGVRALTLTLRDLVSKMDEKVALVHAVPYTANRKGFSSTVEKIYFGTQHTRVYISAHVLGVTCMTGMSTLLRKDYFDDATGGLDKLSQYIAEDYFMAKFLADGGYKMKLASYPALQNSGKYGVQNFIDRMIRWTKLRVAMVPWAVLLEPFSECFLSGLLASWSCLYFFRWNMFVVFLYHVLAWVVLDYFLFRQLENGHLQLSKCDFLCAWFVRESLTPYIIFCALWDPTISWRTGKYRLRCGGKAEEVVTV